jgi:phage tail tape-measure protein
LKTEEKHFISDFATRTQFGVEELSRSFITLKASGIEPTEKLLRVFTDTAAVTTDQLGTLDAMTRVFSRGVQGGLGLEELNQIADRGVPVFKILEEQLGITRLEIAKFGQSTEGAGKILEALQVGLNKEFGGATETKLDNLSIATSNLQIALATAADEFGQGGFTGALTEAAVNLTEFIESNKEGIRVAGEYAGEIVSSLSQAFINLSKFIGSSRFELLQFLDALGFDVEFKTQEEFSQAIADQSLEVENLRKKLKQLELVQTITFAKNTEVGKMATEKLTKEFEEQSLKLQELQDDYHHFRLAQAQTIETTIALNEAQALNQESLATSIRQSGEYVESLDKIGTAANVAVEGIEALSLNKDLQIRNRLQKMHTKQKQNS